MPIKRPSSESQPRPHKAVDVLQATDFGPEGESMFDPKIDIRRKDEREMLKSLEEKYLPGPSDGIGAWWVFSVIAADFLLLFPEQKDKLRPDEIFNQMKLKIDDCRKRKDWLAFCAIAKNFLILYPNRKAELKLGEAEYKGIKIRLERLRKDTLLGFFSTAMRLLVLYPECRVDFGPTEAEYKHLKERVVECRHSGLWSEFLELTVYFSIFYPDQKDELGISEIEFNKMKALLDMYRSKNDWYAFSNRALFLTILSADHAQITADGQMKLTYKKKDIGKKPKPLPIVSRV